MRSSKPEGFTLLELMVVVLVIGIIVAIAIPLFLSTKAESQRKTCQDNQRTMYSAINTYVASRGTDDLSIVAYPGTSDTLTSLSPLVPNYLQKLPKCPSSQGADRYFICRKNGKPIFITDKLYASTPVNQTFYDGHQLLSEIPTIAP